MNKTQQQTQIIRWLDVFLVAPFLIYTGVAYKQLPDAVRVSLIILGIATAWYNGNNYLKYQK